MGTRLVFTWRVTIISIVNALEYWLIEGVPTVCTWGIGDSGIDYDVIIRSSSVRTGPPVAPKPVRTKALHRSNSSDAAVISEETSSFNEVSHD